MSARLARAATRGTASEQGNVLLMVLVLIIVVGIVCAALLPAQQSGLAVQKTLQTRSGVEVSSDTLIDQAITQLRNDGNGIAGMKNGGGVCQTQGSGQPLVYLDTDGKMKAVNPASPRDVSNLAHVGCAPFFDSETGGGFDPYPNALVSLGGQSAKGSFQNTRDYSTPFCDDYAGGTNCEPGILIGRGTTTYNDFGMLISTPDLTSTVPLVVSNSSIIINQNNINAGSNRFLQVEGAGGIWARRGCMPFQALPGADQFQLNYSPRGKTNPVATYYTGADRYTATSPYFHCWLNHQCALVNGSCSTVPEASTSADVSGSWSSTPPPMQDPIDAFRHQLWGATNGNTWGAAGSCTPSPSGELVWTAGCGDFTAFTGTTASSPLTPPSNATARTAGNVAPANPVQLPPVSDCAKGYVRFQPGYYNNADALNAFLSDPRCHQVVMQFTKGVYYFDFNGPTYQWGGPAGTTNGMPQDAPGINEQLWLTGGTEPDGTKAGYQAWTPCWNTFHSSNTSDTCTGVDQPNNKPLTDPTAWKVADPVQLDVNPNTVDSSGQGWNETPPNLPGMAHIGDGLFETATVKKTTTSPVISWGNFTTPIPEVNNGCSNAPTCYLAQNVRVKVRIAYNLQNPSTTTWKHHEITFSGANVGGSCTVMLPVGTYTDVNPLVIDLSNGCPKSATSGSNTLSVDGQFWGTANTPPDNTCTSTCPNAAAWTPVKVNSLGASAKFQLTNGTTTPSSFDIDGIELLTHWQGPPSPDYPHGCDGGRGGVQFIFGGKSQFAWNNASLLNPYSNTGSWVDLCADTSGPSSSNYGPVVVGLTDHGGYAKYQAPDGSAGWKPTQNLDGGWKDDGVTPDPNAATVGTVKPAEEAACCGNTAQPWATSPDPSVDPTPYPGTGTAKLATFAQPLAPLGSAGDHSSWLFDWSPDNPSRPSWADVTKYRNGTELPQEELYKALNADDGKYIDNYGNWTDSTQQKMTFNLPMNIIPAGSQIDHVEIRMKHAEQGVAKIKLAITPAQSNGGIGGGWTTDDRQGAPYPKDSDLGTAQDGSYTIPVGTDINQWQYWNYGRPLLPQSQDTDPMGANFSDPMGYTRRSLNPNWANERAPSDETLLGTPQALFGDPTTGSIAGAQVTLTAIPLNGYAGTPGMRIDMLTFHVVYRPPGTLRPLRGCLTTRPAHAWQTDTGGQPFGGLKLPDGTTPALSSYLAVGTDRDWSARSSTTGMNSDDAYTWNNVGQNDTSACALITMNGPRFHVDGSIYAPTSAIDLVGNDNEAAFVTNAMVVRHYTATRWKNSFDSPALRDFSFQPPTPRHVTLTEKDAQGNIVAQAVVHISGTDSTNWGRDVFIDSWVTEPEGTNEGS